MEWYSEGLNKLKNSYSQLIFDYILYIRLIPSLRTLRVLYLSHNSSNDFPLEGSVKGSSIRPLPYKIWRVKLKILLEFLLGVGILSVKIPFEDIIQ